MSRTIADIDNDIFAIKAANPHWMTDPVVLNFIAAVIYEIISLQSIFHF